MPDALMTSAAVTVSEGCRVDCTVVGDTVECEFGDRDHNIMITFVDGSLAEFIVQAQGALAKQRHIASSAT